MIILRIGKKIDKNLILINLNNNNNNNIKKIILLVKINSKKEIIILEQYLSVNKVIINNIITVKINKKAIMNHLNKIYFNLIIKMIAKKIIRQFLQQVHKKIQ